MSKLSWAEPLQMEMECARILKEQEDNGVYFDVDKAHYLIAKLESLKELQYKTIRPYLNYSVIIEEKLKDDNYSYVKKITNKDKSYTISVTNWYSDPTLVDGPFSRVSFEEPSLSKRGSIIKQLLKLGWKPLQFTEKGMPKMTDKGVPCESLLALGPFGEELSKWYIFAHRQSQIAGFLPHIREDHRISAQINSCATNTFRCAHKVVANIPRPTSIFGKEMRSLFCVEEGRKYVGADLSGLEARVLAHHMNDQEYIDVILKGDIHLYHLSKTQNYILKEGSVDLSDLKTEKKRLANERDIIKTWFYGFIYGSGDSKSGKIIGGSTQDGKNLKETFFKEIPALSRLLNKVRAFAERNKYLPSIDGRAIRVREFEGRLLIHTGLNCKLQGDGSIVAKRAMIIAYHEIKKRKLDAFQVIFYHDELGYDSAESCAEEVGQILVDSMRKAGEYYNLRIPIDGEYGVGHDWGIH